MNPKVSPSWARSSSGSQPVVEGSMRVTMQHEPYKTCRFRCTLLAACAMSLLLVACGDEEEVWPVRAELMAPIEQGLAADDPTVRAETMRLLAASGLPDLQERLRAGADDPSLLVRYSAIGAQLELRQDGAERALLQDIGTGSRESRRDALLLALRLGRPSFQQSALELAQRENLGDLRDAAFRYALLSGSADEILSDEFVIAYLKDDPELSGEALRLLVDRQHAATIDRISTSLGAEDHEGRLWALRALGSSPLPSTWPFLRWIRANGEQDERELAMLALVRLGDRSGLRDVLGTLRDGRSDFTLEALRALSGLSDPDLRDSFLSFLDHQRPEIRLAALNGLVGLGVTPLELMDRLGEPDPDLKFYISELLLEWDPSILTNRLCPRLRIGTDTVRSLEFLWFLRTEIGAQEELSECRGDFEFLLSSQDSQVAALAARLYYSTEDSGGAIPVPSEQNLEAFYAFLDESISRSPRSYRHLYRDLLDHRLFTIRLIAAVGLLKAGT